MPKRLTILVSASIAATPTQGGSAWAMLQYVLGLRRLGHEVYLIEPISPGKLSPHATTLADSDNARFFKKLVADFRLEPYAALMLNESRETVGLPYDEVSRIAHGENALLNISGLPVDESIMRAVPVRVYVDLDPAFTQLWADVQRVDMQFGQHTHFVTIGLAIGTPTCPVPTCGLYWIATPQPIVLEHCPSRHDRDSE